MTSSGGALWVDELLPAASANVSQEQVFLNTVIGRHHINHSKFRSSVCFRSDAEAGYRVMVDGSTVNPQH